MFLSSEHLGQKHLAEICRRMGIALEAGIDVRKVCQNEAGRGPHHFRNRLHQVSDKVARGESVYQALSTTDRLMPSFALDIILVGEKSGNIDKAFLHLADHYDHQIQLKKMFLGAVTWPLIQLIFALAIMGFMIFISPIIGQEQGIIHGFGSGLWGLVRYLFSIACTIGVIYFVMQALKKEQLWTAPLQQLLLNLPYLGNTLRTIAISRFAWTLSLATEAGMNIREAVKLSLRSMQNIFYTKHLKQVDQAIIAGNQVNVALRETGAFPEEFLGILHLGEESGRLSEVMKKASGNNAHHSLKVMTIIAGFVVWALVASIIVFFIFKMASLYFGPMYDALEMINE